MTTRLIEECFNLEKLEELYCHYIPLLYIVDSYLVNIKDIKPMEPGKIIRLKVRDSRRTIKCLTTL